MRGFRIRAWRHPEGKGTLSARNIRVFRDDKLPNKRGVVFRLTWRRRWRLWGEDSGKLWMVWVSESVRRVQLGISAWEPITPTLSDPTDAGDVFYLDVIDPDWLRGWLSSGELKPV